MQPVTHLGSGVYHLDSHYIKPGVASLYCIEQGGEIAIIETGTSRSLPYVEQFLENSGYHASQVKYVIPTHVHLDHAGGAGVMMQAFPEATLLVHPSGARHMIDPEKLVSASKAVYGDKIFDRLYGQILPVDADRVQSMPDGQVVELNGRELIFIDTPGHAYHHFCVVDAASQGIFTGDTFGLGYPNLKYQGQRVIIPTTTPTQFNPQALHQSIDRLMTFAPQRMYLTHFNVLPEPNLLVDQYRRLIDQFVDLTEQIKPGADDLPAMQQLMQQLLATSFDFTDYQVEQLAMDIKLNCQGLTYWYLKNHD